MSSRERDELLGLPDAAARLGVHYMTAYRYVRTGMLPASRRHGRWEITASALESFASRAKPAGERTAGGRTAGGRRAPYRHRLVERMLASDVAGAWSVVERAMAAGTAPRRVCLDLIGPALREIGERWAQGDLAVGEEHAATSVASRLLGRVGPLLARRGPARGTVVMAGAPGERHGLPMIILADVLRCDGWDVVELGPDTPIADLVTAVSRADRLVAVAISVGSDATRRAGARAAAAARRTAPGVPVLIGGPGIEDEAMARRLGADIWGRDADAVSASLDAVVRR